MSRYLHPYEELHRKLGGSLLVSGLGSKRSNESKRSFNARYLTPLQKKTAIRPSRKTVDTEPISTVETADETQSLIQDNESIHDELSMPNEELTLSGMVKDLAENLRKAKKEKETKSKRNSNSKPKIRRTSVEKSSKKSQKSCDEDEDFGEEEEDEEPKRRKKIKKTDDTSEESGSTVSTRVSKRKSSTSKIDDETTEIDANENKIFNLSDIEPSKVVEVRYGSGKNTYHAKIVKIDQENETMLVHYLGWNNRYDEWIHLNQIMKIFSDDYGAFKRRKLIKQEPSDLQSNYTKTNKNDSKNLEISKRSSLSSISSSSSGETKKDLEPKPEIKAIKARSSESTCSLVSSECNNAIEKISNCTDKAMVDNVKEDEILSIKEEIVEYDHHAAEQADTLLFIETITKEIVEKCLSLIENMPKGICSKEELMPVYTSEMVVCETSQFKEKVKVEMMESVEKKSALNETNLNSVSQNDSLSVPKVHKEKENFRHDLPKFPYHLIGCSLVGKPKIKFIEEQMRLCREEYAKLKNELAVMDRKRKKLKRNMLEKSASNLNADESVRQDTKK